MTIGVVVELLLRYGPGLVDSISKIWAKNGAATPVSEAELTTLLALIGKPAGGYFEVKQ